MIRTRNVRRLWNSFSKLFIGFGSWKTPTGKQVPKALNRRNVGLEQLETRWMPASVNYLNNILIIEMNPDEVVTANTSIDNVISYTSNQPFIFGVNVPGDFSGDDHRGR